MSPSKTNAEKIIFVLFFVFLLGFGISKTITTCGVINKSGDYELKLEKIKPITIKPVAWLPFLTEKSCIIIYRAKDVKLHGKIKLDDYKDGFILVKDSENITLNLEIDLNRSYFPKFLNLEGDALIKIEDSKGVKIEDSKITCLSCSQSTPMIKTTNSQIELNNTNLLKDGRAISSYNTTILLKKSKIKGHIAKLKSKIIKMEKNISPESKCREIKKAGTYYFVGRLYGGDEKGCITVNANNVKIIAKNIEYSDKKPFIYLNGEENISVEVNGEFDTTQPIVYVKNPKKWIEISGNIKCKNCKKIVQSKISPDTKIAVRDLNITFKKEIPEYIFEGSIEFYLPIYINNTQVDERYLSKKSVGEIEAYRLIKSCGEIKKSGNYAIYSNFVIKKTENPLWYCIRIENNEGKIRLINYNKKPIRIINENNTSPAFIQLDKCSDFSADLNFSTSSNDFNGMLFYSSSGCKKAKLNIEIKCKNCPKVLVNDGNVEYFMKNCNKNITLENGFMGHLYIHHPANCKPNIGANSREGIKFIEEGKKDGKKIIRGCTKIYEDGTYYYDTFEINNNYIKFTKRDNNYNDINYTTCIYVVCSDVNILPLKDEFGKESKIINKANLDYIVHYTSCYLKKNKIKLNVENYGKINKTPFYFGIVENDTISLNYKERNCENDLFLELFGSKITLEKTSYARYCGRETKKGIIKLKRTQLKIKNNIHYDKYSKTGEFLDFLNINKISWKYYITKEDYTSNVTFVYER